MRAMFLRQKELEREFQGNLNGGRPGWNDDEPAVVELVFRRILKQFFGGAPSEDEVIKFLDFVEISAAGNPPIDRPGTEILIREALGEEAVRGDGFSPPQKFVLQGLISGLAALHLELDEHDVDRIIVDCERTAFESGWKPPLARRD